MMIHVIGWSVVAAVVAWRLAWHRARTIFSRAVARAQAESRQLQAEVDRWKSNSIRLSKEIAAWKAGHQEGRADAVSMGTILMAARETATCSTCAAADQVSSGM